MKPKDRIWLTWHYSARSRNLAKYLNINIYEIFILQNLVVRHLGSSIWTIWVLARKRPNVIYLQLSFLLLVICVLYKIIRFKKVKIIADCHTKALRRKARGILNHIFWPLKKISFTKVDLAIISNEGMVKDITLLNLNYLILPDKIPDIDFNASNDSKLPYCVYVSSFAVDEPVDEIIETARMLNNQFDFYWTGKVNKSKIANKKIPPNLFFTGYLSFEEYYDLIGNTACIVAFTTENECLQSGAYEALAVETPMVISNTNALRKYFSSSAVYSSHIPAEIKSNILYAVENNEYFRNEIRKIKIRRNKEFEEIVKNLVEKY